MQRFKGVTEFYTIDYANSGDETGPSFVFDQMPRRGAGMSDEDYKKTTYANRDISDPTSYIRAIPNEVLLKEFDREIVPMVLSSPKNNGLFAVVANLESRTIHSPV